MTKAEKNYTTSERECLAILWSILNLPPYLEGTKFTVRTDHNALRWLLNIVYSSGRLARWRLRLSELDFEVQYHPGRKQILTDGVSRLCSDGSDTSPLDDEIPVFTVSAANDTDLADLTRMGLPVTGYRDLEGTYCAVQPGMLAVVALTEVRNVMPLSIEEFLREHARDPYCQSIANHVGKEKSQFDYDRYGVLVRASRLDGAIQRVVPKTLRARIPYLAHYPRLAGHPVSIRMYYTLRRE